MASRTLSYATGYSGTLTDLNLLGTDGLVVESPGELMTDIFGLSTCTAVLKCPIDRSNLWPGLLTSHPIYPNLHMERRRIQMSEGYYVITAEYAGILGGGTSLAVYELCIGVADEPIETHPKFTSEIGGTPSNPMHGAVFLGPDGQPTSDDAVGQFAYFTHIADGSDNPFAGIESYLAADQVTWRERYVSASAPGGATPGKISSPPGGYGGLPSAVNWILVSRSFEQRGLSFFVTNEWRAGGRRGWNTTIYGS